MIFRETKLKGAYIIELEKLEDERGFFARSFCKKEFEEQGLGLLKTPNFPWEEKGHILAKELVNRFVQEYGSITGKDILKKLVGFKPDFWTKEGIKAFDEAGGHQDKCPGIVARVASWVAEIILREKARGDLAPNIDVE